MGVIQGHLSSPGEEQQLSVGSATAVRRFIKTRTMDLESVPEETATEEGNRNSFLDPVETPKTPNTLKSKRKQLTRSYSGISATGSLKLKGASPFARSPTTEFEDTEGDDNDADENANSSATKTLGQLLKDEEQNHAKSQTKDSKSGSGSPGRKHGAKAKRAMYLHAPKGCSILVKCNHLGHLTN